MKKSILPLIFLLWGIWGFCQNVDLIKKANLFDQNRGYMEEEEATGDEIDAEEEIKLPKGMPMLDGIVVIGDYKKAIFTYHSKKEKRKVSKYHGVGDEFGKAVLKEITPEYVVLLFDGKKYKLYPDTKLKVKKSSGNHRAVNTPSKPVSRQNNSKIVSRSASSGRKVPSSKPKFDRKGNAKVQMPSNSKAKAGSTRSNPFSGGSRPKQAPSKKSGSKSNTRIKTPF